MVTNYNPEKAYKYSKLKNVLYLVSSEHVKNIHIDNGEAYIDDLSETPTRIKGFNIQFTEEEALDERYKFGKTVTLSVNGYADINSLNDKYYAIIETVEGTLFMVNIDFPSRITHTYTLSNGVSQTDFTFKSQSNYPTLKLSTSITASDFECTGYRHPGKISLKLIDKNNVRISTHSNKITTYSDTFKDVKFVGNTCTLKEEFDGERVTDTITFDILMDDYKTSWHYNLLEFLDNLYASIISVDGEADKFYSGFNFGLIPSFAIKGGSSNNDSNIITVTLTEASVHGMVVSDSITGDSSSETTWRYVKNVGDVKGYECVGVNTAQYTLQQEVDAIGNPTGRYKALVGHENDFPSLNIVGTFSTVETFYTTECGGGLCQLNTSMPTTIFYDAITCETYSLSSTCQWDISDLPSYITASPVTGNANTNYSITVCNNQEPTADAVTGRFKVNYGGNTRIINVTVQNEDGFIKPPRQNVDCLPQTVTFSYDPSCPITVVSIDPELEYNINGGTFTVTVPRNLMTSSQKVWSIIVEDCNNQQQTVYVVQDRTYEAWVDTQVYECYNGDSYVQQMRYTGTTPDNITTPAYPRETRRGALIMSGDPRCNQTITRYEFLGNYYCIDGNKIKALEQQISYDGGLTWEKTGLTQLGETVETASTFCETTAQTEWRLSEKTQCGDDVEVTYTFTYCNGQKFVFEDVPATGGTYDYCVSSSANTALQEYNVLSACPWTTVSLNSTGFSCTVDENHDTDNDRECYIVFKQKDSAKLISLNVVQKAGTLSCEPLLDSCCGRGNNPDYDIELGAYEGSNEDDGIFGGCTVRMTSTLPSWLNVTINSNYVNYEAIEANTGQNRSFVVEYEKVTGPTGYCDTATCLVKQLGGGTPSTDIFCWQGGTIYQDINPSADAGTETLDLTSTIDGVTTGYTVSYDCNWVSHTANTNNIVIGYTQNETQSSRTCRITLEQQSSHNTITLVVNQSAGEQGETYFRWGDDSHMYEYSATTAYNGYLPLVPFVSKVNGVDTNATMSTDVAWIQTYNQLYYNYNELKPNRNETIYLDTNYTEQPRTGTLTLTQKTTGDVIRVVITQAAYIPDCSMTSFDIEEEVCIGQGLDYTFTVADTRCTRTVYFNLFQGTTMVRSTATPSGGYGSGVFQTSTLSAGTATVTTVVNGQQITRTITVQDCS